MTLKLEDKRLIKWPITSIQQNPRPVTSLSISRNRISEITKEDVESVVSLTSLDASCNFFPSIPFEFQQVSGLQNLNFSSNFIVEWPKFSSSFSSLKKVDLSLNLLTQLPAEFFISLPVLEELTARQNKIESIPDEIAGCLKLKKVDLSNNQIKEIPPSISKLQQLTTLNFESNELKSLHPSFGALKSLQILNLAKNQLETLPNEIKDLKKVHTLRLNDNNLTILPENTFSEEGLSKLKLLTLSHNQLSLREVFPGLCSIETLKVLDLSHNLIDKIPAEISTLTALEELHLQSNQISHLPESLFELDSLKFLNLSDNLIETLPSEISNLSDLVRLIIAYNKLKSLPSEIAELSSLEELVISGNPIEELPPVEKMIVLQALYSANTLITKLPDDSGIQFLYSLEKVDFSHNPKLDSIPEIWSHIRENHLLSYDHTPASEKEKPQTPSSGKYKIGHADMQGKRESMEDGMCTIGSLMDSVFYYGVFDGHGDSIASNYCAQKLHQNIKTEMESILSANPKLITEIDNQTNQQLVIERLTTIVTKFDEGMRPTVKRTGGTTAVFILIVQDYLFSFNIGDSRAVLCRADASAQRVSFDHKPFDVAERQRIRSVGGYVTLEGRVNNSLAVSRSLGDYEMYPYISSLPYVSVTKLSAADDAIVLACDGLWDVVSDTEASKIYQISGKNAEQAAVRLRDTAYFEGSEDNISVLVISLN